MEEWMARHCAMHEAIEGMDRGEQAMIVCGEDRITPVIVRMGAVIRFRHFEKSGVPVKPGACPFLTQLTLGLRGREL